MHFFKIYSELSCFFAFEKIAKSLKCFKYANAFNQFKVFHHLKFFNYFNLFMVFKVFKIFAQLKLKLKPTSIMKLKFGIFSLLLSGLFAFTACDDDDSDAIKGNAPDKQIEDAFKKQFPEATQVKWSSKNGYTVASFRLPQNPTGETNEAWYDAKGECALSEIEIANFNQLPAAVKEHYNTLPYASEGWKIDDIDALTRQQMALVYKIEIEKAGQPDHDLLFAATGQLISDKIDADDDDDNDDDNLPVVIPQPLLDYIDAHMPGAVILDFDKEDGELELEVIYNNKQVELYFTPDYQFIRAEEDND